MYPGRNSSSKMGIYAANPAWKEAVDSLLVPLPPAGSHILGRTAAADRAQDSIVNQRMPAFDPALAVDEGW